MLLPLNLLRKLQLSKRQRVALAGIFSVGGIIIAIAVVRLLEVSPATREIRTDIEVIENAPLVLGVWSHIEASVAVVVASLPTFRFLLSRAAKRNHYDRNGAVLKELTHTNHTIGSAGKKKRFRTGTTTLGSLDDENGVGSVEELNDVENIHFDNPIRKDVECEANTEPPSQPNSFYFGENAAPEDLVYQDGYNRVHPTRLPMAVDADMVSSGRPERTEYGFI